MAFPTNVESFPLARQCVSLYNVDMPKKKSPFKKHMARVDAHFLPVKRDAWFWMEHVVHWHLFVLVMVALVAFSYLLFDPTAPALAGF